MNDIKNFLICGILLIIGAVTVQEIFILTKLGNIKQPHIDVCRFPICQKIDSTYIKNDIVIGYVDNQKYNDVFNDVYNELTIKFKTVTFFLNNSETDYKCELVHLLKSENIEVIQIDMLYPFF